MRRDIMRECGNVWPDDHTLIIAVWGEGTLEKHASLEDVKAGNYGQKPEALKIVGRTNVKEANPHYGRERSHITKAEMRQLKK